MQRVAIKAKTTAVGLASLHCTYNDLSISLRKE
jgi:hypothetical protein